MRINLFNTGLLFALFGISLGFFGMLYEGVILIPKMLYWDLPRLKFWHDYYSHINPAIYYLPLVPIATVILLYLYIKTKSGNSIKKELGKAALFQFLALALTLLSSFKIDLKFYLNDIDKNVELISTKTKLINIISIIRLVFAALAVRSTFRSYISQKATGLLDGSQRNTLSASNLLNCY